MEHRARVSLGPPVRADANSGPVFSRKRAASVSGARAMPRKSILKQLVPISPAADEEQLVYGGRPSFADSNVSGEGDYQQILSDAPSALRAMRKSEASSRRVSFAADANVRVYSPWHGTPSPARVSPPNRAIFPSEGDYNAMSPQQKKIIGNANRRSSVISTPPRRSMSRRPSLDSHGRSPSSNLVPKPRPQSTSAEDEDVDMDIDDEDQIQFHDDLSQPSDMSIVTNARNDLQGQRPSLNGYEDDGDADMSIVDDSMEIRSTVTAPRQSHITRTRLSTQSRSSDMSVAATEYGSRRSSALPEALTGVIAPPSLPVGEEQRVGHDFVVPLGHRVPRTDTEGNVLSPTQAEKDKAAALAALAALGGENDDEEDEDEGRAPVAPVRAGSEMSVEDVNRHARIAPQDLPPDEMTSSTTSLDDATGLAQRTGADATVNITALRHSMLRQPPPSPVQPVNAVRSSAVPVPKSPARAPKDTARPTMFAPATPIGPSSTKTGSIITRPSPRPQVTKSPVKTKPSFTAAFAPPSVSPRKRSLSVPSPAPPSNKRRAISVEPSPSKTRDKVISNAFSRSSFRPISKSAQSRPTASQSAMIKRNPFLDPQDSATSVFRPSELSSTLTAASAPPTPPTNKENVPDDSLHESSKSSPSSAADKLPIHSQALRERTQPNRTGAASNVPGAKQSQPAAPAAHPFTSAPPRPSITPFSSAPSRASRRLSAAFRARRNSAIPVEPQQSSLIPDPAIRTEEPHIPSIIVSQECPSEIADLQRQSQAPSPQIADEEALQSKILVQPTEPTEHIVHDPRNLSPSPLPAPEPPLPTNVRSLRPEGPRVSTSTYAARSQPLSTSTVEKPRRRMSFAPRARLSAAPEDLQTTATRGDTMAASNPLEQASSQPSQDNSETEVKSIQDEHGRPGRFSVNRRISSLPQRRSSVQPATGSTQSNSVISSQDVSGTSQPLSQEQNLHGSAQPSPSRQGRRRSTFARASLAPILKPQQVNHPSTTVSLHRNHSPSVSQMMPLTEFIHATGHRFQNIPVDLPVQWRQEDSDEMSDIGYQLADIVQAIAINYPQLDAYEDFVNGMREDVTAFEKDCEDILANAKTNPPPIVLAWLNGSETDREAIISDTKVCRANAAFQAQATWYPWRLENTAQDLDRALAIREDLADVALMLEDYDKSLPDLLALLRKEHDELRAELDTELAISQQLENCDQGELEDLRAELEAQTEELREKERDQRGLESERRSLQVREQELQGHVQEGEAALQTDNAKISQSGDNTELGALRFEHQLEHLQWLLLWRLIRLDEGMIELTYDSWFRVEMVCSHFTVREVRLSLLPKPSNQHAQFPSTSDVLLALGEKDVSRLPSKSPMAVVRALDRLWSSGAQLNMQLRLLKLFPLTIGRNHDGGIWARAKILLKYKSGRADVTFHLTEDIIRDCPTRIAEVTYDVTLSYGQDINVEDIQQRLDSFLSAIPAEEQSFSLLGSACVDLQAIGSQ